MTPLGAGDSTSAASIFVALDMQHPLVMSDTLPTKDATLAEVTQFVAPRLAVSAIDVRAIVDEAIEDGVERPLVDLNPLGRRAGDSVRVTCGVEMALRLLCVWMEAIRQTPIQSATRLAALRHAVVAIYDVYDDVRGCGAVG